MKQCHVSFQAKVKSTQMLQKSHSLHRLFFDYFLPHELFQVGIVLFLFLVTLFTLQHSTMYSFSWSLISCWIGTTFTFVCFLSPILWSNALCLFKFSVVLGHISANIWPNWVIFGLFIAGIMPNFTWSPVISYYQSC